MRISGMGIAFTAERKNGARAHLPDTTRDTPARSASSGSHDGGCMPRTDRISAGGVTLLQEPQLAHFVTLMADGSPQVTPVWVDVESDGSALLINTAEGRVKS